jgi:cysteine desulfurase
MQNRIYLDNAATTPLDPEVLEAMIPVMRDLFGNPSSTHGHGRKVKALIEEARGTIAKLLKCQPSEIFFTSGGTEADNLALRSAVMYKGVKNIITSVIEHHAVLHTAEELHKSGMATMHLVQLDENGHVNLAHLQELLNTLPNSMVSLMHANNEIGNLLNVEAVGNAAHQAGALFHCDTVQTMGHYPFDLSLGNIDYLAAAAHKFNGPKGVGFIYMDKAHRLPPQITGGAQEREVRGGTENVYGIIGMAKALEICYRDMEKKRQHIQGLKDLMMQLLEAEIPGIEFNGDSKGACLYTVLSTSFPPSDSGNMLLFNLDIAGISASGGSACSSGSNTGSHVIGAIRPNTDRTTVRFSFGKFNTEADIRAVVEKLKTWYSAAVEA